MSDFLLTAYPWIKSLHITFVIFWMAGLFMLPRYFAYHAESVPMSAESEAWKLRERRLLKIILNPAMVLSWVFGLLMIWARPESLVGQGWLHAKLVLVLGLSALHGVLAAQARRLARDERRVTSRAWRIVNEIPTLAILLIVILVVVKPF